MQNFAAGYLTLIAHVASKYGIAQTDLLRAAALSAIDLNDPDARIPSAAFYAALRHVLERSGDPALGFRLAHALDLRKQGFWGYALLSSQTMRDRIDVHRRYQSLRAPAAFEFRVEGDRAVFEVSSHGIPPDLVTTVLDWGFAGACLQHRRRLTRADPELELWLHYAERPHHGELRAIVGGPVVFEAACDRLQLPAADLDQRLPGDPDLAKLARSQLDKLLAAPAPRALPELVRERIDLRLAENASLDRIARELRLSARSVRRQLSAAGTSYHALIEELRRARACSWLADPSQRVDEIARQLGYGDASNFRRAFRRWTGLSPSAYRRRLAADDRMRPAKTVPERVA
ncbi:MAG TPA: AraC family transcriptional regulator ligand-binding domain-containing protein [Polyangiales bacterium]|nr:AraC family transcriptional regulator ligand-binding domain-containing protein [Polyangiales bacterium]